MDMNINIHVYEYIVFQLNIFAYCLKRFTTMRISRPKN